MTSITTIRIDRAALPNPLNLKAPDVAARMIAAALRDEGIDAEGANALSQIRIEVPTTQLAAASAMLASLQLI